jgi:hypothetical protein
MGEQKEITLCDPDFCLAVTRTSTAIGPFSPSGWKPAFGIWASCA